MAEKTLYNEICFYLNGKKTIIKEPPADWTLLQYLRSTSVGLTGTKLGCGEGGCGACTVMVSHYDTREKRVIHRAINACLAPLCSVDGHAVVTIEGIGSWNNMHEVQKRIAGFHGSQCGFCTPGIVMALYAFLRSHPNATAAEIEESFDGNLCRCTGYRSILDAAKTFGADYQPPPTTSGRLCPSTGMPCNCARVTDDEEGVKIDFGKSGTDPIFPPALKSYNPAPLLCYNSQDPKCKWYRPITLEELLKIKHENPDARVVVGSSEVTIEVNLKRNKQPYSVLVTPTWVPELNQLSVEEDGVSIGAAVTLNRVSEFLKKVIKSRPEHETRSLAAIVEQLRWFAGNQIRNVACLGGNIATASPISDINPVLLAVGAVLTVAAHGKETRKIPMDRNFFVRYRTTVLEPTDVIVSVFVPFTRQHEYVIAYKQSRRKDDDIAITSACFRTNLEEKEGQWYVKEASLVYGGMAPITKFCSEETERFLVGKPWTDETLEATYTRLEQDFPLDPHAPGGMITYRRTLVLSFFYKFFLHVKAQLGLQIDPRVSSAIENHKRPTSSGEQHYQLIPEKSPVGQPTPHVSGIKQVTGEAIYLDDIPRQPNELFAAFVFSEKAHAKILSIDASEALQAEGVVAFFSAKDVPGHNQIGPVFPDEELFASEEVLCVGYPIGIVVAHTQRQAQQAAALVKVQYQELDAVLTIEEAIEKNSFHPLSNDIVRGDVDAAWEKCDHVIEGQLQLGGQEHFYFETQSALAIPGEEHELTIFASTQNPNKTQMKAASVLGIPANRVVARTKRMGGGFGGKETRSLYVSTAAALAAYKTRRPVRMVLDRDEDMMSSGGRNPFLFKYKVGFTSEGKILALDTQIYCNAGCTFDLSAAVSDRALFHVDNAYYLPNVRAKAYLCKTNLPTNTAFRGFGGPQGMMLAETYIQHIAKTLGKHPNTIREINMYQEGQTTHYNQQITNNTLPRLWSEMLRISEFEKREKEVAQFNASHRWRKRGIACAPVKFGMSFTLMSMNQASALVHIYGDGTVLITHGGAEMGQGLHTKICQIAAKAFGIDMSKIYISETATDKIPNASPTAASVQSDLNGMAVLNACEEINKRLQPLKEKMPDASWEALINAALAERVDLSAHGYYATPNVGYDFKTHTGTPFAYFTNGACCNEVEIDCLTGEMTIIRADIVMDVGESLNPAIDIGQIEGAYAQGFGLTTLEEVIFDDRYTRTPGKVFTRGPSTYKIPSFKDIPLKLNVHLLPNSKNPFAIHSSKGIGEPPLFMGCSVFFAVKEAIYAAREEEGLTGYFELSSPATCERIRMSCKDKLSQKFDSVEKTY